MDHSSETEAKPKPKDKMLWGGRFKQGVTDIVEKFTESISFDKQLYKQDIMLNIAHASMLAKQGLISDKEKDIILQGLNEITRLIEAREFTWRSDREDVHMNIEAALTDLVGEPAKKLHTARSRNDQVVTAFLMWCREAIDRIASSIRYLQVVLVKLALNNEGLIIPGYTHLQRAQPVLLQHHLLAYVEQLDRDIGRFLDCRVRVNVCPLGACALAGTGLPIDRFMTSDALGFDAPIRNSIDAISDRDFVLEFLSANSIVANHLSRISEEWVLWATEEFGFITPSDSVSTGSSIMPQKKNPDPMELVRGKSGRVIGDMVSFQISCKGLPPAYNRDLQGIPFRTSHEIVGRAVALCVAKNCQLQDLTLDEFRSFNAAFDKDVYEFLGVENAINKFTSYGSTGPACVDEQLHYWVNKLEINHPNQVES